MSRKDLEAKKRHHYVWAHYLARWGRGTKNVFYSTKNGRIAHDSVRALVVEDFLYKVTPLTKTQIEVIRGFSRQSPSDLHQLHMSYLNDFLKLQQVETLYLNSGTRNREAEERIHALKCNLVENLHSVHERSARDVLDALANEDISVLQADRHMIEFMIFFGHQISRTKTFRDSIRRVFPRRNPTEIAIADTVEHGWWFLSYMFGMSLGRNLYASRRHERHSLLINNTQQPFITADQPVVNVHTCVSETEFDAPEHADFFYPISPRVALMICESERFKPGKVEVDEATVIELNSKLASQAMFHLIGDSEEAIRPYMKHLGRRHQKFAKC